MRIYAVGDIHGCIDQLNLMIELILDDVSNQTEDWKIIFLGDYTDRGPNSPAVIRRLMKLQQDFGDNIICLMGNHDLELTLGHVYLATDTLQQYRIQYPEEQGIPKEHMDWLKSLKPYYEDNQNYYIHGGLTLGEHPKNVHIDNLCWLRDTEKYQHKKVLVVGHTPHSQNKPKLSINDDNKLTGINVDGSCVYGGHLLCAIFNNGIYDKYFSVKGYTEKNNNYFMSDTEMDELFK